MLLVRWLNALIMRCAWSWPGMAIAMVGFAGTLFTLIQISQAFVPVTSGFEPFDAQNDLTAAAVHQQLTAYSADSRRLYLYFTLVDYAFPFFAGLFTAAVVAFFAGVSFPRAAAWVGRRRLWALFFVGPLFDWMENVFAAFVVFSDAPTWSVTGMLLAKKLKLALVLTSQAAMPVMAVVTGIVLVGRRVRQMIKRA